jgi:hypothetical protein
MRLMSCSNPASEGTRVGLAIFESLLPVLLPKTFSTSLPKNPSLLGWWSAMAMKPMNDRSAGQTKSMTWSLVKLLEKRVYT